MRVNHLTQHDMFYKTCYNPV